MTEHSVIEPGSAIARALSSRGPLSEDIGSRDGVCEKHGTYTSEGKRYLIVDPPREIWSSCPTCLGEREAAEASVAAAREAELLRARTESMMQQTCIPARFVGRTLDTFKADSDGQARALRVCRRFADEFDANLRTGASLILSGMPGTGKSHLAAGIIQAILPAHVGVYVTMMDLIRMLRDTWRKDSTKSEADVLAQLSSVPLLVVDEIGLQYGTDGERTLFTDVMDRRYRDQRPVILITNQGPEDFRVTVGDRVYDRLTEVARWIPFEWQSYRTSARKEAQR